MIQKTIGAVKDEVIQSSKEVKDRVSKLEFKINNLNSLKDKMDHMQQSVSNLEKNMTSIVKEQIKEEFSSFAMEMKELLSKPE